MSQQPSIGKASVVCRNNFLLQIPSVRKLTVIHYLESLIRDMNYLLGIFFFLLGEGFSISSWLFQAQFFPVRTWPRISA